MLVVHFFASRILLPPEINPDKAVHTRLMLRSLTEDGEFARLSMLGISSQLNQCMAASLKAAVAAGDAHDGPVQPDLACTFTRLLYTMIKGFMLPGTPVIDYGLPREKLIEQTVWYTLRGMGVKDETIHRNYNPKALALFAI